MVIRAQALVTPPVVKRRGLMDYRACWAEMRAFTAARDEHTADEVWLVEHASVFTLGLAGKAEHILDPGTIPIVRSDRGGQVTFHGPGQVVAYVMLDLRRHGLTVRGLVRSMEQSVIDVLRQHGVEAARIAGAPGVYVDEAKVAALGVRIVRGCSYHGLALNVDMDLGPFLRINPCGYAGMRVTQTRDLGIAATPARMAAELGGALTEQFDLIVSRR